MSGVAKTERKTAAGLSRRLVLLTGGAAGAGLVLGIDACTRGPVIGAGALTMWLAIAPDGVTTIRVVSSDLGQGAQTGLAQIVADELDADWSKIRVEMAPVTDAYFVHADSYYTGGSGSIRQLFARVSEAGAAARAMLVAAAAKFWNAPAADCSTQNGTVVHVPTGRTLSYGALANDASRLPIPVHVAPKPVAARKLIGKSIARLDIPDKVNGRAIYGIDVKIPGMRIATLAQCPFFGGKLEAVDGGPALAVKGVEQVVKLESAVAVVARNFVAAKKGLDALDPRWTRAPRAIESDAALFAMLTASIGDPASVIQTSDDQNKDAVVRRVGEKFRTAGKIVEAEYRLPILSHSPIEPMNATAYVTETACQLWAPMQNQKTMRDDLAAALKMPKSAIVLHTTKVGGGFGRRLKTDYGVLAAQVAKAAKVPVKLIWTREEDMTHDFYRPASICRMRIALNSELGLEAIEATGATTNDTATEGLAENYDVDLVVRQKEFVCPLPIGAWRSVDASINTFILESLIDEIAHGAGLDPLAYRRKLLAGKPRQLRVLDTVAGMADWGRPPSGHFQGVAFFRSAHWEAVVAEIVELSVDAANKITLHRVCCAIDVGTAVNPNQVIAQAEGGIILALSAALGEAITLKDGRVEQTNFDSYPILRLRSIPRIDVQVLESPREPIGGAGEPPVPPAAAALANAIFAATGKRIRTLPLSHGGFTV
ncbi:MAG: molybdopterin cofactor-binding domain-containing protein [Rhizomicrobium sp.]|jgi:isoquinoline 1-oxidoreductase beta subunit